jgi:hypothetical protein
VAGEVDDEAVEAVGDRRAGRASGGVVGPEHEVVDEQPGASPEQVGERRRSLVGLEAVVLVDPNPGQLLPPPGQLVAASGELLLRLEQLQPRGQPLLACPCLMSSHGTVSFF